jgi:hypothetical protein
VRYRSKPMVLLRILRHSEYRNWRTAGMAIELASEPINTFQEKR